MTYWLRKHWHLLLLALLLLLWGIAVWILDSPNYLDPDTPTYIRNVGYFEPNWNDWRRPPVTELLFRMVFAFSDPANAWFLLNYTIFSIGILLLTHCIAQILESKILAFSCLSAICVFEVFSVNFTLAASTFASEGPYANMILFAICFLLLAQTTADKKWYVLSAAVISIAIITRPIGKIMIPIWLCRFILVEKFEKKNLRLIACSVILMIAPSQMWAGHNFLTYGHFADSTFLGRALLSKMLPTLQDDDTLFSDTEQNKRFIEAVRKNEDVHGTEYDHYAWFRSKESPGPFGYLEEVEKSARDESSRYTDMYFIFEANKRALRLGIKLFFLHPAEGASLITETYRSLFSVIKNADRMKEKFFRPNVHESQIFFFEKDPKNLSVIRPVESKTSLLQPMISDFVLGIRLPKILVRIFSQKPNIPMILVHLEFLLACLMLLTKNYSKKLRGVLQMIILFGLVTFSHLFATAAFGISLYRYYFPTAVFLHLLYAFALMIPFVFIFKNRYLSGISNDSDSH